MNEAGAQPQPAPLDLSATVRILAIGVQIPHEDLPGLVGGAPVVLQSVSRPDEIHDNSDLMAFEAVVVEAATLPLLAAPDGDQVPLLVALGTGSNDTGVSWTPDLWLDADTGHMAEALEAALSSRRLGAAAREIDRLRAALSFARGTAHDLAQPLTTVMARSQLLLSKTNSEHPHHRPLAIIAQEAERLAESIGKFQSLKEMATLPVRPEEE